MNPAGQNRRRCPVCWRLVARTQHGMIEGHWDTTGIAVCPATAEPYEITLATKRKTAKAHFVEQVAA